MSRRDMILIAVLVNAGLLSVLFITAIKTESESGMELPKTVVESEKPVDLPLQIALADPQDTPLDEVDHVLKEYLPDSPSEPPVEEVEPAVKTSNPTTQTTLAIVEENKPETNENFVKVTVKKGDALEKIAKLNRTTAAAIMKANNMTSDRLKVGQVLNVPVGAAPVKPVEKKVIATADPASSDAVYYTVKSGDNPWKIAKQYGVKFDDILRLNGLTQESAKNMKAGDKVRVK